MTTPEFPARPFAGPARAVARTTGTSAAPFALRRRDMLHATLLVLAAVLLTLAANVALLRVHPGRYDVDVGNFRDKYFLDDAHRQETAEDGTYRWTQANSTLYLTEIGVTRHALLELTLGGRPEPTALALTLNGAPWVAFEAGATPRRYTLLLPPGARESLRVGLHSGTFQVPGDPRQLGVKLDGFGIVFLRDAQPLPLVRHVLAQVAVLALLGVTTLRLGWGWRRQALLLAAAALALAAVLVGELLLAHAYLPRLAVAALALALLTWIGLPALERVAAAEERVDAAAPAWGGVREARVLWALMLAAIIIRLALVLYPTFAGQDLGRNIYRHTLAIAGQLIIIAPSGEFAKGLTIYPPGPYLGLMPLGLLTEDLGALLQGSLAIMDGISALVVALLARRLGGGTAAGRMALVLYAGNIMAFGAMSYSFSAQIYGQWFTAPMLLLLLAANGLPQPRTWLLVYILMAFQILSHIGVMFLAVAWLGLTLALLTLAWRRILWWGWIGYAMTCAACFVMLYIFVLDETLGHAQNSVLPGDPGVWFPGFRMLLVNGLRIGYSDIGLLLLPLGLWLIWHRARGVDTKGKAPQRGLRYLAAPAAMLVALLFYLLVDLTLDVQVRYFYFALPLVLAAVGVALGFLAERWRWGWLVAWSLTLAIIAPMVALWVSATLGDGKIPMTPLTH